MKIIRSKKYTKSLQDIMKFISIDSKKRALVFRGEIDKQINSLVYMPYKCRKSIYFENENIRDLIFKGYTVVYNINEKKETITIIGIKKYKNKL
jgi:mRNA-degrading endonuclease RelE of RelBE toxin-antitoxin system